MTEQLLFGEDDREPDREEAKRREELADRMYGTDQTWKEERRHNRFLEGDE